MNPTHFERYKLSSKIRAKGVRVIKDKMCILKLQDTFVSSRICQKCKGTQIIAFLSFVIKEGRRQRDVVKITSCCSISDTFYEIVVF